MFERLRKRFCRHRFRPIDTMCKWNEQEEGFTITETCFKCGKQFSFTFRPSFGVIQIREKHD